MIDSTLKGIKSVARSIRDFFRDYPRLVSQSDAFSLNWIQLHVGDVEADDHAIHPGISFQMPQLGWPINRAVVLSPQKASEFVEFLSRLETEQLPCAISFPRHDGDLEWKVVEVRPDWHGGGGFVGYLKGNWLADHSNPPKVVITRESVTKLRQCINDRFRLASD